MRPLTNTQRLRARFRTGCACLFAAGGDDRPTLLKCTLLAWLLASAFASGCASKNRVAGFTVPEGQYPQAFDAAKEALRDFMFLPERIDSEQGVISTRPKATSGLATPWDSEQSTIGQELEDLLQQQTRVARITFTPADPSAPGSSGGSGHVEVVVYRTYVRGWRPSTKAILYSGFSRDPVGESRGRADQFQVPVSRDDRLAERIAGNIRDRLTRTVK